MEMLVDPLLSTWVPDWVTEQYERANPFFRDVLRGMRQRRLRNNAHLLQATRKEMVRRHERHLRKEANQTAPRTYAFLDVMLGEKSLEALRDIKQ